MKFHPIICPQITFVNKHGAPDAYHEMNPAIYIKNNGEFIILVRLINYRKFVNRSFTLSESKSISKYYILKGVINDESNEFIFNYDSIVEVNNPFPKYNTYWLGLEDVRFINEDTIIATIPENNTSGLPRMVLGKLHDNIIEITQCLEPSVCEKNWMPFYHDNSDYVIYSVSPLKIKLLDSEDLLTVDELPDLNNYHGSTNGIPYESGALFLIHESSGKTQHRWLYISFITMEIKYSDPFIFLQHSYIEFPCSLVYGLKNEIMCSLGVNDNQSFIVSDLKVKPLVHLVNMK